MSDGTIGRRELFKRAAASGGALGLVYALGGQQLAEAAPAEKVPTRKLGTTGEDIPILFMGGSQKFDPVYDRMLHRAYQEGVFYIDTAQAYANGQSHVTLAPFIEQVGRENLWITSKVDLQGAAATPATYRRHMDSELPVRGTDYLDMFFFHLLRKPDCLGPEFIKLGDDLRKEGKTKFFGFSCHDGNVVEMLNKAASIGAPGIDAIMFRYNFTMYGDLELNKAMDACKAAGIGLLGMKTQSSVPQDQEEVKKFVSNNFTLHQARLKAAWADERIDGCVSGMTNIDIMKENVEAAKSTVQLSMNEFMQLNQYAARTASYRCQGCTHLCEAKVDGETRVGDMLRYLMYAECYGDVDEARQLYARLSPAERAVTHDFREAAKVCPQGIDIQRRLQDAVRVLA